MRRIFGFCIVAAVLAAMTSCGTARRLEQLPTEEEELTQRWAGKEYSDIVQEYGEPDHVTSDGKDGSLLIYEDFATVMETEKSLVFNDDYTTTVREKRSYTHFFLDQEGFCYLVKTNRYVPGTAREKARDRIFLTTVGTAFAVAIGIPIVAMISHSR